MAQDAFRLWKPYSPESFGGGHRSNDGVYSSLSGVSWSISTPTGGYIGATTAKGDEETRDVYSIKLDALIPQTNSLKINMMSPTTTLGTRFEVGNRRGHHGWLVGGYGLPGQSHRMSVQNVSMAIRDEGDFAAPLTLSVWDQQSRIGYLWGPNSGTVDTVVMTAVGESDGQGKTGWVPVNNADPNWTPPIPGGFDSFDLLNLYRLVQGIWYLNTQNVPQGQIYYRSDIVPVPGPAIVAPLPMVFQEAEIKIRSHHQSVELMYTHRVHPFTWGSMELLVGARYWDFEDAFGFSGANLIPIRTGGTGDADTPTYRPIAAFEEMLIDAKGINHVFGPQVGVKLHRSNARWTFGAEGRFTTGINAQIVKTGGYLTPHRNYIPVGLPGSAAANSNPTPFGFEHKQNKSYFSPIGELRLSADWQWTEAVSFFGALDGMAAGNIARGVRITDYVVKSDGTIFGIRGNDRNTDIMVYGAELGIKIRR